MVAEMAMAKPKRRDALPEFTRYQDTGCEVSPSCFTCPLARCRYDDGVGVRALRREIRVTEVLELRERGMTVEDVARQVGRSRRTIFRDIAQGREN